MFDPRDIAYHAYIRSWAVAELAEAGSRVDRHDEARRCIDELEDGAAAAWSPILDVGLRIARPLLAADQEAEALFQDGLNSDVTSTRNHSWPVSNEGRRPAPSSANGNSHAASRTWRKSPQKLR